MLSILLTSLVLANGQSSHCWISTTAIEHLPAGGLRELMTDPNFETQWRNGTMFPDGGYAVGDDYGEIAHWEPFQISYLNWIKENYGEPWSDEAKQHIAFLMGLASHGMADQSYDSMYFRRAYQYDADGNWAESFDTATDVAFISQTSPQPVPDKWIPLDAMLEIYQSQDYMVDSDTLERGQTMLQIAIQWVGGASSQEELVEQYNADFPWGTTNQLNERYPGSPPTEAEIVSVYWQVLWAQLLQQTIEEKVLYSHPSDGSYQYPRSMDDIEADLSVVFAKGLDTSQITDTMFAVYDSSGMAHPIGIDVFYGADSHVVNIHPLEDWAVDEDYQLVVSKDLVFRDQTKLEETWTMEFSTKERPKEIEENATKSGCQNIGTMADFSILSGLLGLCWRRKRDD